MFLIFITVTLSDNTLIFVLVNVIGEVSPGVVSKPVAFPPKLIKELLASIVPPPLVYNAYPFPV